LTLNFSKRTAWDLRETAWARELGRICASGAKLFDLTASNPTHCGFRYEPAAVLSPLVSPRALGYSPDPRGSIAARQAVCRYYAAHGVETDPANLLLTTGSSEAYSFLFRLLADPGDEILIAQPGYPLFDFLAQLDDVHLAPYELFYDPGWDHAWQIDFDGLRQRLRASEAAARRPRAIIVVHPNNPTGHLTPKAERENLQELCREHGLALIVDEVFLDYGFGAPAESFAADRHDVLTFVLSGVSKIAALPQMKVAWIAAFGPGPAREEALARLEVIADTFLSVNAAADGALPSWLDGRHALQRQIRERTARNLAALDAMLQPKPNAPAEAAAVTRLHLQAGWYAVLHVPAILPDEENALALLTGHGVAVHPGSFFGFPQPGRLVVSLLAPEEEFTGGISRLLEYFS
jgi:aspartate/methionine/tyrosine aminotransferase